MGRETYSDEELIELLKQKAEEMGSSPKYIEVEECPDLPSGPLYQKRFGSFNNALKQAGLEIHKRSPGRDIEELSEGEVEELTERAKELFNQGLSRTQIRDELMVEMGTKKNWLFDFIRDEVITDRYVNEKIWGEFLSNTKGWGFFYPADILEASEAAKTGPVSMQMFIDFVREEKGREVRVSMLHGKPFRMYIHPSADIGDIKKLYLRHIERLPADNEEIIDLFIDYVGQGRSPKTVGATIEYVMEVKSQRDVCEKWGVSDTQVRKLFGEVVERIRDIDESCLRDDGKF